MTSRLVGEGLDKSFAHRKVLKNVNIELIGGQTHALMGKNGAGKTTLLRILAGLLRPDRGGVHFYQKDRLAEARPYLGVVLHSAMLYPDLTAFENLRFFAELYQVEHAADRALGVLQQVNLLAQQDQLVRTLSRGMTQRLSLARALIHSPSLLLLDEPFSGLDADSSQMIEEMLLSFRSNGGSVLFIAHDFETVAHLADDVSILLNGKIAAHLLVNGMSGEDLRAAYKEICGGRDE